MENHEINFYTKDEVVQILGVAESTVYGLVRKGILETEVLPPTVKRAKMYTKESVAAYKQRYKPDLPTGAMRLSAFAKRENISLSRLYDLCEVFGELAAVGVGERQIAYLTEEQQKEIQDMVDSKDLKAVKTGFYNKKYNVALYQLLIDEAEKVKYRVILNDENEWGVTTKGVPFMDIEQALNELGLESAYGLHQPTTHGSAYVTFHIERGSYTLLSALDFFYRFYGVKNMHISYDATTGYYSIAVKEGLFEFSDDYNMQELAWLVDKLSELIQDGEVTLTRQEMENRKPNVVTIKLKDVFVATRVNDRLHKKLVAYAEQEGIPLNKVINQLLEDGLKKLTV